MGKSVRKVGQSSEPCQPAAKSVASKIIKKSTRPSPQNFLHSPETSDLGGESSRPAMENDDDLLRVPLSHVVSDCVKRWFSDTLKEAKAGDISMQVLVGQMYFNGYGVPKDAKMARIWMTRASRVRSSVWKVSNKRPGYNASDSDSDEEVSEDR